MTSLLQFYLKRFKIKAISTKKYSYPNSFFVANYPEMNFLQLTRVTIMSGYLEKPVLLTTENSACAKAWADETRFCNL